MLSVEPCRRPDIILDNGTRVCAFPSAHRVQQGERSCGMEKVVELEAGQGDEDKVVQLTPSYYILKWNGNGSAYDHFLLHLEKSHRDSGASVEQTLTYLHYAFFFSHEYVYLVNI